MAQNKFPNPRPNAYTPRTDGGGMTREQKLERLKKLERLEALEAQEAAEAAPKGLVSQAASAVGSVVGPYVDALQYPQKLISQSLGNETTTDPGKLVDKMAASNPLMHNPLLPPPLQSRMKEYDPVAKGVADMLLNAGDDPMNIIAGLLSRAAIASRAAKTKFLKSPAQIANVVVNPFEARSDRKSNELYGKAAEELDRVAKLNNKEVMPSQLMRDNNFVGGPEAAEKFFPRINKTAGKNLGVLRKKGDQRGVTVNFWSQVSPAAQDEAGQLRKLNNPDYDRIANGIDEHLDYTGERTPPHGEMPFSEAGARKSAIDSRVARGSGFGEGYAGADSTQVQEAMANAYREAEAKALKTHAPDMVPEFERQKAIYSSSAPLVQDKAESVAARVANRRGIFEPTQVEGMMAGHGIAGGDPAMLGALFTKKGLNLWTKPVSRTARGFLYDKASRGYGLLDSTIRQATRNPWSLGSSENSEAEQ